MKVKITEGGGARVKSLTHDDALLAAGYLLQCYQRRQAERQKEVAACGSERAFDGSMRDLARLVVHLQPALAVNVEREHLPDVAERR